MAVWILEDNLDRTAVMRRCLHDRLGIRTPPVFVAAQDFIENIEAELSDARLISLDHDLDDLVDIHGATFDPGTGRVVADFLAKHKPVCPAIIHSTNVPAAVGMEMVLQDAGWQTVRITPYDDTVWIEDIWIETVVELLGESVPESVKAWPFATLAQADEALRIVEHRIRGHEADPSTAIPLEAAIEETRRIANESS